MTENNRHMIDREGNMDPNKVGDVIDRIEPSEKDRILRNFDEFKSYLGSRVHVGQSIGLGEEQLAVTAEKVAGYLAEHEEPRNSEENLLKELWNVGRQEERHALAHMLVRLALKADKAN
ncbi:MULTISPECIES: DUF3243 domain-containing protein [Paenibacillus]|uniref:DUF3243 family protein n=1 Tax=Paenibacillus lutrae TaxID=2078573 RepID=A0A7X3FM48_9BACL|nr:MULTISPECIES: DUF3243 domain-containing protein [Paenibacillus]MVP01787.1 DUF3243 family protein [Paenibacillus lutrae]